MTNSLAPSVAKRLTHKANLLIQVDRASLLKVGSIFAKANQEGLNLTQDELATIIGCSRGSLSNVFLGKSFNQEIITGLLILLEPINPETNRKYSYEEIYKLAIKIDSDEIQRRFDEIRKQKLLGGSADK